ncbi:MAG: hypothetical protein JNJ73_14890 [Hyphomonadaceae bacterium]|nr:hypothetical protein [Hyphomonadaceae bacterium]
MANASPATGNADFSWDRFDSESYFQHYYGDPHPDDDNVIRLAVAALGAAAKEGPLDIVDVGTGPNFIPLFAALPVADRVTVWEYARSNCDWLAAELEKPEMRPQWKHFWRVAREAYMSTPTPIDPIPPLRAKTTITQGSIYDLPARRWTAATMFFCAESITGRMDEFEQGCAAYARCVKPGGILAAAFLVRSGGYIVGDRPFPVLSLTPEAIEDVFSRHARDVVLQRIGIVEREIRSGYSGFVFLTGRAI